MKRISFFVLACLLVLASGGGVVFCQELPSIQFQPEIALSDLRVDLAEVQMALLLSLGVDPEKIANLWVAQSAADGSYIVAKTPWWPEDNRRLWDSSLADDLTNTIEFFGDTLMETWGEDWVERAQARTDELEDVISDSYMTSYTSPDGTEYSLTVISPFFNYQTLQVHEGTFIVITERAN